MRDFARARLVGQWSTLGVLMARAVAYTPPEVVLPPTVGDVASLNMIVALTGSSAAGKGTSEAAARACTNLPLIDELPIGSGEGIARTFAAPPKPKDEDKPAPEAITKAIFTASEIDTVAAIGARQGSTLLPTLRQVYSGETLGSANSQAHTRVIVPAHSYRACVIVGVQYERARVLVNDTAGTRQRMLWLPTADRNAPDVDLPVPDRWNIPRYLLAVGGQRVLSLPREAVDEIKAHRRSILREDPDVDHTDGHRMLTREKVAAALMLLDGRCSEITVEDWELAGIVMRVSDATRARIERTLSEERQRVNRAKAHETAEREETVEKRRLDTVKRRILAVISEESMARGKLRAALGRREYRDLFEQAVLELEASGSMVAEADGNTTRYRISEEGVGLNIEQSVQPSKLQVRGDEHGLNIEQLPTYLEGQRPGKTQSGARGYSGRRPGNRNRRSNDDGGAA
ncbi:hypothetical protein QSJ19_01510 [Gordonia sp. ABSL11-1]|uniref:hypothetical protein n=1 Tax=Gordonia sp. ABSL11-1 TaxID=3053924 RepID=UPI0025728AD6|nr:hypothetical protein [Gordonia sp. ABSL11-1]MDL9944280.1 hypothetical protein [Gordonia sp. ABSL11-1]